MKFVADRKPLLEAAQRATRVAPRRTTIPILGHCLLNAGRRGLTITASDTERQVTATIEAIVDKPGTSTVDAQLLAQFVAGAADGCQIEASLPEPAGRLTLRAGRARAVFPTLPVEDFPPFSPGGEMVSFTIEGATLAALLQSVQHAQSNEETRYYLNGVFLHRRAPRELAFVATNGHCLARTLHTTAEDLPEFASVIVPRDSVAQLADLAAEAGAIEIEVADHQVRASAGDVVFATKLIDGTFPDYERVIPDAAIQAGFEVERELFILAAKRVALFTADDKQKSRTMKLTPNKGTLQLQSTAADEGEISDELDAALSTKVPVGINSRYVTAALEALGGKITRIRYADAGAPIVFTDPAEPNRLQVVMAMRV